MNGKTKNMKGEFMRLQWILLALCALWLSSCKDDKDTVSGPYDPNQPVEVTDFTPKSGGGKKKMIIYGSNFGTDPSIVSVKVGGKEAIVISAKGTSIYCSTPEQCFEGTVEVKVGEQTVVASRKYEYVPEMVVSDLCGDVDELGKGDIIETGPFDDCGKIDNPFWFSFDPQNHNILYLSQNENSRPLRVLDLKNKMIYSKKIDGVNRTCGISWTKDGNMVIATPQASNKDSRSNIILEREPSSDGFDFKNVAFKVLTHGKACNGSMIHPVTGEIYFNYRAEGSVYRYDFVKNGYNNNPSVPDGVGLSDLHLFNLPTKGSDFSFVPHPSGEYVYIIMHEAHYILRSNFDEQTQRLVTPYIVCGQTGQADYKDLVGTKARINHPGQGVFVYNEEYEKAGRKDCYDFYFADRDNHCIRTLTPDGIVSTFAGRGSASTSSYKYGKQNGEVRERARFNKPHALAYDEETKTFYVGDTGNYKIRKIALETKDDIFEDETDDEQTDDGQSNVDQPEKDN